MTSRTTEQILADFVQASITFGEDLCAGRKSPRESDKAYGQAEKAFKELQALGEEAQVLGLLEFAHPAVRLMAAGFALRFKLDVERGQAVLESLANGHKGPYAAHAYATLYVWRRQQRKGSAAA